MRRAYAPSTLESRGGAKYLLAMHHIVPLGGVGHYLSVTPEGQLSVDARGVVFTVDPRTGATSSTAYRSVAPSVHPNSPAIALPAHGLRLSHLETLRGPVTRLLDAKSSAERAVFAGKLECVAIGDDGVYAGLLRLSGGDFEVVAGRLGGSRVLRIGSGAGGSVVCAGPGFVAATSADPCALHVLRAEGDFLARTSVALPDPKTAYVDAVALGTTVWVVVGRALVAVDTTALPRSGHTTLPIVFAPLVPPPKASTEIATVAFALPSGRLGFDHPRFGRIQVTRGPGDPVVARGDEVVLDDVTEELPGVFRVRAWHPKGGGASVRPPPPPVSLDAPSLALSIVTRDALPVLRPEVQERGGRLDAKLAALAAAHGFRAPETLLRVLAAAEDDPVVKRWLSILGCIPEVWFPCGDWGADPFVLAFGGLGNGDVYALYPYPPALGAAGEAPIVEWSHETNEAELAAHAFDAFFSTLLASASGEREIGEIAELLVRRLGLPAPVARARPPRPAWLPRVDGDPQLHARADALLASNDVLGAERVLVSAWMSQGPAVERAKGRLEKVYAGLGWTLPLEALRD